jgi:hypothetical protein
LEDGAALAEKCLTQAFAIGKVGGRESLEGLCVANGDEIRFSNIRNDGDIRREVKIDVKRDEFVER